MIAGGIRVLLVAMMAVARPAGAQPSVPFADDARCEPSLTSLFAPPVPDSAAGVEYLVCYSTCPLEAVRPPAWATRDATVDEAFAGATPEVRRALSHVYRGRPLQVARGWIAEAGRLDSFALIAPPPADSLDRIIGGTLIVRTRIPRRRAETPGL